MTVFDPLPEYRLDPDDDDDCPECGGRIRPGSSPAECLWCGWTPDVCDNDLPSDDDAIYPYAR